MPPIKEIPVSALNPFIAQVARLSASCPALNEVMTELETLGGSLGSSPMHATPLSRKNSSRLCFSNQLLRPTVLLVNVSWEGEI